MNDAIVPRCTPPGEIARRRVHTTRDGPVFVVYGAVSIQATGAIGTGGPQTATAVSTRAVVAESRTGTTARGVQEHKPTPETWARKETFLSGKRGQVYLHNAVSKGFPPQDIIDLAAELSQR